MKKPKSRWRLSIQIIFFVLVAAISANHSLALAGVSCPILSSASLHAICPFGGVVSIYQIATAGTYVQKTHAASFILMIIAFLVALLFGPSFCGWLCPLGSIQEWFGKLGRKTLGRRSTTGSSPAKVNRVLRYLRYAVLAWVLYMTAVTGKLIFADYDPYFALFNLWSSDLAIGGVIALAVTLAASLIVERPFCKYACPYGAVLGVFNLIRVFGIRRNPPTCTNCKACNRACPMNIQVSTKTSPGARPSVHFLPRVHFKDTCILEGHRHLRNRCSGGARGRGAGQGGHDMNRVKTKHLAIVVPLVFAAGIGLTMAFNLWKTETTKEPVTYTSGEFAGQANPADIRGSYTFADIAKAFPVPLEDLARAFGITENAAAFQVKSLRGLLRRASERDGDRYRLRTPIRSPVRGAAVRTCENDRVASGGGRSLR